MLHACNWRETSNTPERNVIFVQRELDFHPHIRHPGPQEPKEIGRPQDTAGLANDFHLLLQHRLTAVASQNHEIPDRTFSSVQILIEATSFTGSASHFQDVGRVLSTHTEIVCLQDQKNDPRNFAQKLDQLSSVSSDILHLKTSTLESPPATCLLPWHLRFAPFPDLTLSTLLM